MPIHNQFSNSLFFNKKTIADASPDIVFEPGGSTHSAHFSVGKEAFRVDFKPSKMSFTFHCTPRSSESGAKASSTRRGRGATRTRTRTAREARENTHEPVVIRSSPQHRLDVCDATRQFLSGWTEYKFDRFLSNLQTKVWGHPYPTVSLQVVEKDGERMAAKLLLGETDKAVVRYSPESSTPYLMVLPDYIKGRHVVRASSFNELARVLRRQYSAYTKLRDRAVRRSS